VESILKEVSGRFSHILGHFRVKFANNGQKWVKLFLSKLLSNVFFEMELMRQVQDFGIARMQWVCVKQLFRSYLGNEERSEDEVDGGLTKVIILKGNRGCTNHICKQ